MYSKNRHIKVFFRCTLLRITCKIWRVLQSCFHFASESILLHGTIHTYVQGYICVRTVLCVHMWYPHAQKVFFKRSRTFQKRRRPF